MSEEKPTFKVTDRRLFNPDGSPRFTEDEAETAAAAATATAQERESQPAATATATAATTSGAFAETAPREATAANTRVEAEGSATADTSAGARRETEADADPEAFANLIMFIASPAAAAMGMTEHPGMGPMDIDLPLAKHCIDLLGTLQQKTRSNLGQQEQQMLEGLLGELRMQYVSLLNAPPQKQPGPRGFTGGDITGGR